MQNGSGIQSEKGVFLTQEAYDALMAERNENNIEIAYLKQELAQMKRMIFGSKSERFTPDDPGQLSLGLDVEQKEASEEQETEDIAFTRRKSNKKKGTPVRLPLPSHLHREKIDIEPDFNISGAKKIGVETTELLEYKPGTLYVIQYNRPKYVLPKDQGIVIGDLPSLPIPRGNAGPGLLSYITVSKFMDHLYPSDQPHCQEVF